MIAHGCNSCPSRRTSGRERGCLLTAISEYHEIVRPCRASSHRAVSCPKIMHGVSRLRLSASDIWLRYGLDMCPRLRADPGARRYEFKTIALIGSERQD